jgi:hypothetical protein
LQAETGLSAAQLVRPSNRSFFGAAQREAVRRNRQAPSTRFFSLQQHNNGLLNMANDLYEQRERRLRAIEDRKIEILIETANVNRRYSEKITKLDAEYVHLDEEYYRLRVEMMSGKGSDYE